MNECYIGWNLMSHLEAYLCRCLFVWHWRLCEINKITVRWWERHQDKDKNPSLHNVSSIIQIIISTLSCQQAPPRLQTGTRGLSWKKMFHEVTTGQQVRERAFMGDTHCQRRIIIIIFCVGLIVCYTTCISSCLLRAMGQCQQNSILSVPMNYPIHYKSIHSHI